MNIHQLARTYHCKRTTISRILRSYQDTGGVEDKPRSGRKRKSTPEQDKKLVQLARRHDDLGSPRYQQIWKEHQGVEVSSSTVRRRLLENGLPALSPTKKPILTENQKNKRVAFCLANRRRKWRKVVFTDETSIKLEDRTRKVRRRRGEKRYKRVLKHPGKLHVWGCLSVNGFGKLYTFQENLTGELYVRILDRALRPSIKKFGIKKWILQEDGDPKHRSNVAKKWKSHHRVGVLSWPANSPDLNPIENAWKLLKDNVFKRRPTSVKQLEKYVHEEWNSLKPEISRNLVSSMSKRMRLCLVAKGDSIKY
jgi:transposase